MTFPPTMLEHRIPKIGVVVGWFFDEVYRVNYFLVTPCDSARLNQFIKVQLKQNTNHIMDAGLCADIQTKKTYNIVLALRSNKITADNLGLLSHECHHASFLTLQRCGVSLNRETAEAFAYLHESLVRRYLTLMGVK